MKRAAQVTIGTGILLLAGWWWLGQYPGMALAKDKKQETKSVKVRLLDESGNRKSESGKSEVYGRGGGSEGLGLLGDRR